MPTSWNTPLLSRSVAGGLNTACVAQAYTSLAPCVCRTCRQCHASCCRVDRLQEVRVQNLQAQQCWLPLGAQQCWLPLGAQQAGTEGRQACRQTSAAQQQHEMPCRQRPPACCWTDKVQLAGLAGQTQVSQSQGASCRQHPL